MRDLLVLQGLLLGNKPSRIAADVTAYMRRWKPDKVLSKVQVCQSKSAIREAFRERGIDVSRLWVDRRDRR